MRFGIDATTWRNPRGYGRFTREMLRALAAHVPEHDLVAVVDGSVPAQALPARIEAVTVHTDVPPSLAAAHDGRRSLRDMWRVSRAMRNAHADVLFFPTVYTYVPVATRRPVVVAIHDAIPERNPHLTFASRRARWFWTAKLAMARRQAATVVTVSETSRGNLVRHLGVDPLRIAVVSEAPAACFTPRSADEQQAALARHGLARDGPLILHVGGLSPHKNLSHLVESVARLARETGTLPILALAGGSEEPLRARNLTHWVKFPGSQVTAAGRDGVEGPLDDVFHTERGAIASAARRAGVETQVRFLGFVPDEDLAALYSAATVVVMASIDEGFGLPAIEAMACGAPVVVTRAGSLPEVVGDAALLVDPRDVAAMADALGRIVSDAGLQRDLAARGLRRAAGFTWRSSAETLARILVAAVEGARA